MTELIGSYLDEIRKYLIDQGAPEEVLLAFKRTESGIGYLNKRGDKYLKGLNNVLLVTKESINRSVHDD